MAQIIRISSGGRFPRRPKGSPKRAPTPTGAADRGRGTGNNRFTKTNNWTATDKATRNTRNSG